MKDRPVIAPESLHNNDWDKYHSDFHEVESLPRIKIAAKWIKDLQPKLVLDIGCGPGHLAKVIKKQGTKIEIHGIDFSKVAIENAKKFLDKCWQVNLDVEDIPVNSNSYDAVICLEVLEHVYDVDHVIREIRRVLKSSGWAMLSVPNLAYWRYRLQLLVGQVPHDEVLNEQHIHVFNFIALKDRISRLGLKVERCWGYGERMQKFAFYFPQLFSSTLFVEVTRKEL